MTFRRLTVSSFIFVTCLFATGCFSIEQEIFLNADGSGEFVVLISLPDLPEQMNKTATTGKKTPDLEDFRKDLTASLPPSLTLKEAKEVKHNGVQSLYAVFRFKQLDDVKLVLTNLAKGSLQANEVGSDPQWSLDIQKKGPKTYFRQSFVVDVDSKAGAAAKDAKKDGAATGVKQQVPEADDFSKQLEEQMKPVILSIIRMRFVLHAPSPITETNADIVLNEKTAVWNCSLVAFAKEKKPIEMKAAF